MAVVAVLVVSLPTGNEKNDVGRSQNVEPEETKGPEVAEEPEEVPSGPVLDYSDDLLKVANKKHSIKNYVPTDLMQGHGYWYRKILSADLEKMLAAAQEDGVRITIVSAYRSYDYQASLYNGYVVQDGKKKADTYSARAGHSEHQLGLAFDFGSSGRPDSNFDASYATTAEGKWLKKNSYKYGFILRYTQENTGITGYMSEPWHYRYIGKSNALAYRESGAGSFEEFLGVEGGDYE